MIQNYSNIKFPAYLTEENQEFWLTFIKLGLDCEKSLYPNDTQFINILKHLNQIRLPRQLKCNVTSCSLDQVLNQAHNIQSKLFKDVDLNVDSFIDEFNEHAVQDLIKFYDELDTLGNEDLIDEDEYMKRVTDYFMKNKFTKNVFDIPVAQSSFSRFIFFSKR